MKRLPFVGTRIPIRPWTIVAATIGALIVAIFLAGVVLIRENERVHSITEQALRYDIEIEDEGDDIRVAVLDLRHYQRDIMFGGPSNSALAAFDQAYSNLLEELEELDAVGLNEPDVMMPERFRELARVHYDEFRAATDLYTTDRATFDAEAAAGLRRIEELDRASEAIDDYGEFLTNNSLERLLNAAGQERFILIGLITSVVVVGIVLALSAVRLLSRLDASHQREQVAAVELAKALRLRTDFIADASHELRTPLTVIQGNAEIGLTTPGESLHREVLTEISIEATRMSKLVDDLLFLARSDAGRPPLDCDYVSARWLTSRMERPAEVLARQRGSCLETDFQGDGFLELDQARIEQAVQILVDNAARYNSPDACIRLSSRVRADELSIIVADKGSGIPSEELPLIFDRFYRVRNRRERKKNGSGLGLAIAKTIVEAHHGSISAESRVGSGTTMTIRLPLASGSPVPIELVEVKEKTLTAVSS
ncbi:MAG: HAMP domain-containing histidine kinase [Chloroflexota bacterium]|nr:HAMP domain-containing histidine kinase [Chloroflexota bacterium]